jgi:hypothetical protein
MMTTSITPSKSCAQQLWIVYGRNFPQLYVGMTMLTSVCLLLTGI